MNPEQRKFKKVMKKRKHREGWLRMRWWQRLLFGMEKSAAEKRLRAWRIKQAAARKARKQYRADRLKGNMPEPIIKQNNRKYMYAAILVLAVAGVVVALVL